MPISSSAGAARLAELDMAIPERKMRQVKDLPLQFSFDDSMSMQTKLSSAEQITVVARVSKSNNTMSQPGDLQGTSALVKPGAKDLTIVIDTVQ